MQAQDTLRQSLDATKTTSAGGATFKVGQPTRHLHSLRPHPDNPREDSSRDDPAIKEMAESIIRHGIIEPIVIAADGTVIAGHRRRMASFAAYEQTKNEKFLIVPVTVREIAPADALELMLQENMQRQSLTPLEEARAMYAIMERRKLTVADLAREIAVPPATCSSRLAILKCDEHVQRLYAADELPLHAAGWLARIPQADKQVQYAGKLARRELTFAQLKDVLAKEIAAAPTPDLNERATASPRPQATAQSKGRKVRPPVNAGEGHITRAQAIAALDKVNRGRISVVAIRSIIEARCCACGMSDTAEVCKSCPLPRVILGIAGRVEVS